MTVAYVESSALAKLALAEPETPELRHALRGHSVVTSELSVVEVGRALRRTSGVAGLARARAVLLRFETLAVDRQTIERAQVLEPATLRSLDAIHVASALAIESPDVVFYSYDQRTIDAARANGLAVASPGT